MTESFETASTKMGARVRRHCIVFVGTIAQSSLKRVESFFVQETWTMKSLAQRVSLEQKDWASVLGEWMGAGEIS